MQPNRVGVSRDEFVHREAFHHGRASNSFLLSANENGHELLLSEFLGRFFLLREFALTHEEIILNSRSDAIVERTSIVKRMGVVQAKIQTVEDIYQLIRVAVMTKRPIRALYRGHRRWLCPHRLGRNRDGEIRVLCYQYAGDSNSGLESAGSAANWRCLALERLNKVELLENEAWRTAPNHSRLQTCVAEVDVDAEE